LAGKPLDELEDDEDELDEELDEELEELDEDDELELVLPLPPQLAKIAKQMMVKSFFMDVYPSSVQPLGVNHTEVELGYYRYWCVR
jgi:hypothetical protein